MIRRVRDWLRGRAAREGVTTAEAQELLKKSEETLHAAEKEAQEAQALAESLHAMRVQNQFKERMVLKIQGGLR